MKRTIQLLFFCALASLSACSENSTEENDTAEVIDNPEVLTTEDSDCLAHSSWFVTDSEGNRRTPAPDEGATSPFADNDSVTNCDFHQWSWQKFLWLTNEYNGTPLFMDSLHQVTSTGQEVDASKGIVLTDTAQASSTDDILKTPNFSSGTPDPTTVYYTIFLDDLFYNTMVKYGPIANADPSSVGDVTFPVGALEMKTAWIDVNGLADTTNYFITNGEINGVASRVALLGVHVVGVVENHPEFIWATFEHNALVPSYPWADATASSDADVTSNTDYPFFAAGQTGTPINISTGSDNPYHTNVFSVYEYGVPVEISGGTQTYMATSETDPTTNFNNIDQINQSVSSQLTGIWNNYFYNGSLWINTAGYDDLAAQAALLDSLAENLGNVNPGQLPRGSVSAYNITMETFVQAGFRKGNWKIYETTVDSLANCFSCHSAHDFASGDNSPLYISHVFTGYMQSLQGQTKSQIKQTHVDGIRQYFENRAK